MEWKDQAREDSLLSDAFRTRIAQHYAAALHHAQHLVILLPAHSASMQLTSQTRHTHTWCTLAHTYNKRTLATARPKHTTLFHTQRRRTRTRMTAALQQPLYSTRYAKTWARSESQRLELAADGVNCVRPHSCEWSIWRWSWTWSEWLWRCFKRERRGVFMLSCSAMPQLRKVVCDSY